MTEKVNIFLDNVYIDKDHPYTLIFEGYRGDTPLKFRYNGDIEDINVGMSDEVKHNFERQLLEDYGCGFKFDIKEVKNKLKNKPMYKISI